MQWFINPYRLWLTIALLILLGLSTAHALQVPGPLVETEWLENNLDKVVVLDVRTNPVSFEKKRRSTAAVNPCGVSSKKKDAPVVVSGHVASAVFIPWKEVREKRKLNGTELQGMVLSQSAFEKLMQTSGVTNDSAVVVTGTGESPADVLMATRLYWMLKYYGHDNVALLNGGMKKWIQEDRKVKYGKSRPKKSEYKAGNPKPELIASSEDVAKAINNEGNQLVDSRNLEDYLGLTYHRKLTKPDRKGHIPSAKSWPISTVVDTQGTAVFNSLDDLKQVAEALHIDADKPTITYCYSGAQASLSWFVMHELIGNKNTRLYDGSMHEWTQDSNRKVTSMKME